MKSAGLTAPLTVALFVGACGSPSSPSGAVDLRGSWGSARAWRWNEVAIYDQGLTGGPSSRTSECSATIDITAQEANSFQGRYVIDCPSTRYAGALTDGRTSSDNQISFRFVPESGGDPGFPAAWSYPSCQLDDPQRYQGQVRDSALNVTRTVTVGCPQGRLLVSSSFGGTHR
ncbi:MAG TPA: hypothetical protein VFB85_02605 [Vicinamibacterales bacterium]|jgi:hypothetical protein|nr:hypothetical protein [Vicinamibacterales bacterium]